MARCERGLDVRSWLSSNGVGGAAARLDCGGAKNAARSVSPAVV